LKKGRTKKLIKGGVIQALGSSSGRDFKKATGRRKKIQRESFNRRAWGGDYFQSGGVREGNTVVSKEGGWEGITITKIIKQKRDRKGFLRKKRWLPGALILNGRPPKGSLIKRFVINNTKRKPLPL